MGALPLRVNIPDVRGSGGSLRITWHPDKRTVVVSHWRGSVCVASTPVEVSELPGLIGILAEALGEAATMSDVPSPERPAAPSVRTRLKNLLRPPLAKVVDLSVTRGKPKG